jgi:hypothetical protein
MRAQAEAGVRSVEVAGDGHRLTRHRNHRDRASSDHGDLGAAGQAVQVVEEERLAAGAGKGFHEAFPAGRR